MSKVFFDLSISLDGFTAGPDVDVEQPMGIGGERLHDWMFNGRTEEEATAFQTEEFRRVGAIIIGRRTFDLGIGYWGDNPVFHAPCFIVTSTPHEKIVKDGGTSYTFVTGGIESALEKAKAAAGDKDIRVLGGANLAQQYLKAGLLDEIQIDVVPILLGGGTPLFVNMGSKAIELEQTHVIEALGVTHLAFRVVK